MLDQNEADLIRAAKAGNGEAFATFHQRHWDDIYTYLYYRVDNQAVAEDLTSEVFFQDGRKIDTYRYRGKPLLAWLYSIAHNLLIDYYRQSERTPGFAQLDDRIDAGKRSNPSKIVERNQTVDCLRRALTHLTELQRHVIIGKFIDEKTNKEVANLLGRTEGAVKSLQHRALRSLHRAIEAEGCYEP